MKKTGRIIPYNPSILLGKIGYVTYSVPKPEISIKYRIHIEVKIDYFFVIKFFCHRISLKKVPLFFLSKTDPLKEKNFLQ